MTERRLLDEGATDFEAKLLGAGRRDAPSAGSRARIIAGLSVGAGLGTAAGAGTAAAAASKASSVGWLGTASRNVFVRAGLGTTAGAVAVWTAISVTRPPKQPELGPVAPRTQNAPQRSPGSPELEPIQEHATSPASPDRGGAPATAPTQRRTASTPAARDTNALSDELSALEGARRALVNGSPSRTLALLDEYSRKYSAPRLATEAAVLRIEALVARGDRARARQLGQQFLAKNPKGPYERRVRSLIEPRESRQ